MGFEFDSSQLQSKLEQLDKKVQKQISDKALLKGAAITLAGQELSVPKGKTLDLEHGLMIGRISGTGPKRKVQIGIDPTKMPHLRYGFFQEYGTRYMVGKHWMKRAWISTVREASAEIAKSLADDLRNG